jgi:hypothetical protein
MAIIPLARSTENRSGHPPRSHRKRAKSGPPRTDSTPARRGRSPNSNLSGGKCTAAENLICSLLGSFHPRCIEIDSEPVWMPITPKTGLFTPFSWEFSAEALNYGNDARRGFLMWRSILENGVRRHRINGETVSPAPNRAGANCANLHSHVTRKVVSRKAAIRFAVGRCQFFFRRGASDPSKRERNNQ